MKIKAHMAMVLNLDKCLGCHACSIPCKSAWTAQPGSEYMYFNHVETRPGSGWPRQWENQHTWRGGWTVQEGAKGRLRLRAGSKLAHMAKVFTNPHLPTMRDYGEPWDYDYAHLVASPASRHLPTARMYSALTGKALIPSFGPNWEDDLAGAPITGLDDPNFTGLEAKTYLQFKDVFLLHLPRLCGHCLNPACVASCPSGAMYKRDEDGIVLADQTRCRSWRLCIAGCPYKKTYFNWQEHHAEKCHFCYPYMECGQAPLCAQACAGRIRYVGVLLYDADRVHHMAAKVHEQDLYAAHLSLFLDPQDPDVIRQAEADGISHSVMEAARLSPVRKLICQWKLALPLHPEFRTLPMTWYIPPTSPVQHAHDEHGKRPAVLNDEDRLNHMRIPLRYLANMLSAGDESPVRAVLRKLTALRHYMRLRRLMHKPAELFQEENVRESLQLGLSAAGLHEDQALAMFRLLALAPCNERFVIPATYKEAIDNNVMQHLKNHAGCSGPATPDPEYHDEGATS